MTDLTSITTPFGLLDRETQEALKAHGGPYEFAAPENDWAWLTVGSGRPMWSRINVYRVKPAPPQPREYWAEFDGDGRLIGTHAKQPQLMIRGHRLLKVEAVLPE